MNDIVKEEEFKRIPKTLAGFDKRLFFKVFGCISASDPETVEKHEYTVEGDRWIVYHGKTFKMTLNATKDDYHCFFDKTTGFNLRYGKTPEEDPEYCALGPEILDLEVVTGFCKPVPNCPNCRYCYKGNTSAPGKIMSFDTFKKIVDSFPKNLSQIAFGITSLYGNPELGRMFEYCREVGIIPNVTTVGVDLDDDMRNIIAKNCGAVAVSCYTGAKEHCYKVIKDLHDFTKANCNREMSVNMHIVVSHDNMPHLKDVLKDIADKKVEGLKSVVLLRIKPKGRAAKMDCKISQAEYEEIVRFCLDNNISFGFDSCSATPVMEVLRKIGRPELCDSCEPCESSKFSSYISVSGQYWSCSFAEGTDFIKPIDVLQYGSATEWWNSDEVKHVRFCKNPACKSCPVYNLDS